MAEPDRSAAGSQERLVVALRAATRALEQLTASSREACEALDSIERLLSDDWDGREGSE